jgi:tRNA G18 (ribose-2'-O)-methylase SpoU
MLDPLHLRHKPPVALEQSRELVLACAPMCSNINLSRIVRICGCSGISKIICCGSPRIIEKIARDGADTVEIEIHRSLEPVLKKLRAAGYRLVGLEQTSSSESLYDYRFHRQTALILGSERKGLENQFLALLDDIVEIPVYGLPHSHNVATAAAMAMYEYCRQFPRG